MNASPDTIKGIRVDVLMIDEPIAPTAIEALEAKLLKLPQVDMPLNHSFAPGQYVRSIFMPAGAFVIGHRHKTEHLNIVIRGRARVVIDGEVETLVAPAIFVSKPGVRKVLFIEEDMIFATLHPTHETDIAKLEEELIEKSDTFVAHQLALDMELLKLQVECTQLQELAQ